MPEPARGPVGSTQTVPERQAVGSTPGTAHGRQRPWVIRRAVARTVVVRLVVGCAAAWLLFVAAHRSLSGRVWWWTLPDLTPPVAFLVVPVLLLVAVPLLRPARRWVAALALVALALGWPLSGVHPAALWYRPGPVPADAITVFAWNTFYWDQLATAPTTSDGRPAHDPDLLYRYLRAQRADVYLLQEYLYFDAAWQPIPIDDTERLRREFPGYHIAVAGELLTLSRFPIVDKRPLDLRPWLSRPQPNLPPADTAMPDYYTLKTLRTDLRIAGRVVSFYNSHIILPVADATALDPRQRRETYAAQDRRRAGYRALAADVAANPNPIVLAGDLNTSPAMGLIRTLPDRLVDATGSMDRVYPVSWSRYGLPLWRLDWAFTTTDVTVHRYRMVPADTLSDHHGQRVMLSLSG